MKTTRLIMGIAAQKRIGRQRCRRSCGLPNRQTERKVLHGIPEGYKEYLKEKMKKLNKMYDHTMESMVCELESCVYGLHQSGREWNERIDTYLKKLGLLRSKVDPCAYFNASKKLIVTTYVDDLLVYGMPDDIRKLKML